MIKNSAGYRRDFCEDIRISDCSLLHGFARDFDFCNTIGGKADMAGRAENVRWDALQLGRAMARGRKLKAAFSDGKVDHLTTDKGFTHAWCVTGLKGAKPAEIIGWARSEALAQQAAEHHARAVAKFWQDVKSEVVEIETPP